MKKRYLGSFLDSTLNYGNWINWTFNSTIGFPVQFGAFYAKRLTKNLIEKRRESKLTPKRNIFHESLVGTWSDIRRKWRNLAVRTYAGGIVRGFMKEYKKSEYGKKINLLGHLTR